MNNLTSCSGANVGPRFSVILPICHGGRFLAQALASLSDILWPEGGVEIIIAGDAVVPSDLSAFTSDRVECRIVNTKGNRSSTLNAACAATRGSVWVFADDDCVFPKEWLLNVERSLRDHPGAAVIGGADILAPGHNAFDLALDEVLNSFAGTGGIRSGHAVRAGRYYPRLWNMTVRAAAAKRVALDGPFYKWIFDPSITVHEDVELVQRMIAQGNHVVYAPAVLVGHSRDTNFTSFFMRNLGMAQICRRLGIHRTAHLALAAFVTGIPLLGFLSAIAPFLGGILGWAAGAYGVVICLAGIKGAATRKRKVLVLLVPALLMALHIARGAGYLLPPRTKADLYS
jgi:L-malate glycosyltransferase